MTKRWLGITGLLVTSLLIIACGGGAEPSPSLTPTPPTVVVELNPSSLQTTPGEEIVIAVRVNPIDKGISGGEINIIFDPGVMTVVELEPGDLFGPTPLVGAEIVDNEAGTLTYALARIGPTSPTTSPGTFARITLVISDAAQDSSHQLTLTGAGLADEAFQDISDIDLKSVVATVVR